MNIIKEGLFRFSNFTFIFASKHVKKGNNFSHFNTYKTGGIMNGNLSTKLFIPLISTLFLIFSLSVFAQGLPPANDDTENPTITSPEIMSPSQTQDENNKQTKDLNEYIETLNSLNDATPQEKVKALEQFLEDHPDVIFKSEVRGNISTMKGFIRIQEDKKIGKELKDKETYDNFKAQIKALATADQLSKYDEFINTHQDSSQLDTAKKDMQALKDSQAKIAQQPAKPGQPVPAGTPVAPLTLQGDVKDPDHALFMAAVPGLFVPGMGSFYAGDVATGVVLALIRVGGYGMLGGGVVRHNNGLIITGVLASGFSYLIDIAAAPILARDHNEKLEKKVMSRITPFVTIANNDPVFGFSLNF